jgi:hypothetical protein
MTGNREHREEIEAASPLLAGAPREMPYRLPEGYFRDLPGKVLEHVREARDAEACGTETAREEIERLSPLLASTIGLNPFKGGPETGRISPLIPLLNPGKRITPEHSGPWIRRSGWMPYAAAAAVIGIIAFFVRIPSGPTGEKPLSQRERTESGQEPQPRLSEEESLTAFLEEGVDPILLTAESKDSLLLQDAFLILQSVDTLHTGNFDEIPDKDLYAFIGEIPDLTGTRLDME